MFLHKFRHYMNLSDQLLTLKLLRTNCAYRIGSCGRTTGMDAVAKIEHLFLTQMETQFPSYPSYIDWAVLVPVMENDVRTSAWRVCLFSDKSPVAQLVFPQFLCCILPIYKTSYSRRLQSVSLPPSALKISQIKRNFTINEFNLVFRFLLCSVIEGGM
jgi:hypothetical protein